MRVCTGTAGWRRVGPARFADSGFRGEHGDSRTRGSWEGHEVSHKNLQPSYGTSLVGGDSGRKHLSVKTLIAVKGVS